MSEEAPIGHVDLPPSGEQAVNNAVRFEGWAMSRSGEYEVHVERDPRPGDHAEQLNARGRIPLGMATRTLGARPDVSAAFPDYPDHHRVAWNFELRREAISESLNFRAVVHVVAVSQAGPAADLGSRALHFASAGAAPPYLFCARPFDSVFIEPNGDVKPYPDCRPEKAFGSLATPGATLASIWRGPAFTDLRRRIIERDPPPMCLTCAHFINRSVNEGAYFDSR